jgi:hypothetical protein
MSAHQHEDWQVDASGGGGHYCRACGDNVTVEVRGTQSSWVTVHSAASPSHGVTAAYKDGIHRGRRMVPDPERFPAPLPDYAMRTAQGHPPIPEQYRWSPPAPTPEDYSI